MAWSGSGWHYSWPGAVVAYANGDTSPGHIFRVAVYDGTPTPNPGAMNAQVYGGGSWAAGELADPPGWPAGGLVIPGTVLDPGAADTVAFTGGNVASVQPVTMAPHGCLVYDTESTSPAAGMGLSYHWFGGPVDVAAGTFTLAWHPDGIAAMTCELTPVPGGP